MKKLMCLIISGLFSAALFAEEAQEQQAAPAVQAPTPEGAKLSFSPSLSMGARSVLSGNLAGGKSANTFGPYMTPALEFGVKAKDVSLTLGYQVELSGAQGFGEAQEAKAFTDNIYFYHNPSLKVSGGVSATTKLNTLVDAKVNTQNSRQDENFLDLYISPQIERKMNDVASIYTGYVFNRNNRFDSVIRQEAGEGKAAIDPSSIGQSPTTTLHAGVVGTKVTLTEETKVNTFVRAGRQIGNMPNTSSNAYRLQADLSTKLMKDISMTLLYRLNIGDLKGSPDVSYYNMGRVILSYELTPMWSLDLDNNFVAKQSTKAGSDASYENENYVGVTYKF